MPSVFLIRGNWAYGDDASPFTLAKPGWGNGPIPTTTSSSSTRRRRPAPSRNPTSGHRLRGRWKTVPYLVVNLVSTADTEHWIMNVPHSSINVDGCTTFTHSSPTHNGEWVIALPSTFWHTSGCQTRQKRRQPVTLHATVTILDGVIGMSQLVLLVAASHVSLLRIAEGQAVVPDVVV